MTLLPIPRADGTSPDTLLAVSSHTGAESYTFSVKSVATLIANETYVFKVKAVDRDGNPDRDTMTAPGSTPRRRSTDF